MSITTTSTALMCNESRSVSDKAISCWPLWVSTAALLAGCAGAPLGPWPLPSQGHPTAPAPLPSPVATTPAIEANVLPYSTAVAARFSAPHVTYETPGLQQGRSQFTNNVELAAFLNELSQQSLGKSPRLGLVMAGNSQSGQPIYALMATKSSAISPDAIDETGLPTVMVVAGQRGTDAAPTEALLTIAQSLAVGGSMHPLLERANILLVPRADPDGFDKQRGNPTDRKSITLDHLTLHTPEARALAKLVLQYRPAVIVNTEEFNAIQPSLQQFGALRANDAGLQYGMSSNVHEFVVNAQTKWLHRALTDQLPKQGQRVDWAYEASAADKTLRMGTPDPISLANVSALKNIPSITVQSRGADLGFTHIQRRVHTHVSAVTTTLQEVISRAQDLSKVQSFVARDIASQACKGQLLVTSVPLQSERSVVMMDPQTGSDVNVRASWLSSQQLRTTSQRARPCGYWLSEHSERAVERLRLLGIQVQRIAEATPVAADAFTVDGGKVALSRINLDAQPHSYYITMNQPLANVAAAALEPDTSFSYLRNGVLTKAEHVARVMAPAGFVFEED